MKKIIVGVLALTVVLISAPAYSAGPYYIGTNYSQVTEEVSTVGAPDDFEFGTISFNGGAYFSKFFAVEGRVGFGVQDDTVGGANGEIDYLVGAYIRGGYPLGIFEPYLVAGFTMLDTSWGFVSGDDTGFSYGAGADFKFNDKFGLNLEYMYLMDFDGMLGQPTGIDVDYISIGMKYYF